jgi:lysophospholipase L1-like esterase
MYDSFVALGDSFTEGLNDLREDGSYRGWADLVAAELATKSPDFRYANLAVRGRRLEQIRDDQVPRAELMEPSLVGFSAGGNDIIGFRCDVAALARDMHDVLDRLVRAAGTVVVFTGFDPRGRLPLGRVLAARAAAYNASIQESSAQLGAHVVDLWTMSGLYEPAMWAPDRLHLSVDGHALVAAAVLEVLGERVAMDGREVQQTAVLQPWLSARRADAEWFGSYFAPWVSRKVRGRSAGDFVEPKLPELTIVPASMLSR